MSYLGNSLKVIASSVVATGCAVGWGLVGILPGIVNHVADDVKKDALPLSWIGSILLGASAGFAAGARSGADFAFRKTGGDAAVKNIRDNLPKIPSIKISVSGVVKSLSAAIRTTGSELKAAVIDTGAVIAGIPKFVYNNKGNIATAAATLVFGTTLVSMVKHKPDLEDPLPQPATTPATRRAAPEVAVKHSRPSGFGDAADAGPVPRAVAARSAKIIGG